MVANQGRVSKTFLKSIDIHFPLSKLKSMKENTSSKADYTELEKRNMVIYNSVNLYENMRII